MKLVKDLQRIEQIIEQNYDTFKSYAQYYCNKRQIPTSKQLEQEIKEKENMDRHITVGIIGTVNAGKSSLLNALFFKSKRVLPTDAIAMTTALTVLQYGQNNELHIELYSEEDMKDLKKKYNEYKEKEQEKANNTLAKVRNKVRKKEPDIKRRIKKDYPELVAAYEQYSKIKDSSYYQQKNSFPQSFSFNFNTTEELHTILLKYIGADGEYTPFTKSITITVTDDTLKGIRVVDTPGLNDIVRSRSERTYKEINSCDVVLLISSAGSFFTDHDKRLLHRIYQDIKKIHILASKIDADLAPQDTSKKSIEDAITGITNKLQIAIHNLSSEENHLKELLANTQIIPVSSHISEIFTGNTSEESEHTKKRLQEDFPDDFMNLQDNLLLQDLANMSRIHKIFSEVQIEKRNILEERYRKFIISMQQNIKQYKDDLHHSLQEQIKLLNTTDINTLQTNIQEAKQRKQELLAKLQTIYNDSCVQMQSDLLKSLNAQTIDLDINKHKQKDPWYYLFWKDHFIETYPIYMMIQMQQNNLIDFCSDIFQKKFNHFKTEVSKKINKALIDTIQPKTTISKNTTDISNIINGIIPPFQIKPYSVDKLNQGIIYSEQFASYKSLFNKLKQDIKDSIHNQTAKIISTLHKNLEKKSPVQDIISSIESNLSQLQKDLKNKDEEIKRIQKIADKLSSI